ncbi:MAG: replicative DNA helicase [Candidatus Infernicultor aquiphilus]|uniref:Replicative DNA helicase n=1 Tax=Candidatus Infernicultor aquiphilus TaxID=1805029 RepID=A0A1J5GIP5_9BACT|nr:replicative DNA helicase [bacterium]OIP72147.1 MAG: replicative DNA helicase [Candidatus Atribacteria bacterium CG2_30_33_13]PIU25321.1 MAG: replicative DNA helicase [Candidatus Atribacteria bacterium CG08_land_8_20_14_0_20_33_29]PIW11876.1 MAG: replicative DNA helicase [Candidatus Atribacteria bacterium CG17_big_fil_post_rev_8_21_14_2_50_34_11]PIX34831.1 MAG: replicative DNA helicase [Candidatus Atribacteria bacterium CG_4_8_14_3_um_filter_34_18]PIY33272.1 MAG: replicative DNA helicase [Ca
MELGRNPPQNISAEQAALGSMLLQEEAILHSIDILKPEDFYQKSHQIIFQCILDLFEKSRGVDLVTLTEELNRKNLLEKIGGVTYLTNLINSVPTAANIEYYSKIIEEKSILRHLINNTTKIISMAYEEKEDAKILLDKAEHLVFEISDRNIRQSFVPIKEIIQDSYEKIEDLYHREEFITGVPSGYEELDDITTGFQPSELIVVAGRPGMGKTAFCMNIAQYVSIYKNIPVAIFSLEMSKSQLVQRMLCSEARLDSHNLRKGRLVEADWAPLSMAAGRLSSSSIFIDDTAGISCLEIRAKARRLKAQCNLGLVIVDYLQLMQTAGRIENRQQEISEISRSLKSLARELNVPVVAVSQLSRAVEQRIERRPRLSDLRESGAIEQDADLVIFIYREEYYRPKTEKKGIAEIIISKQRNGPTGKVELTFIKEYAKFENLSRISPE